LHDEVPLSLRVVLRSAACLLGLGSLSCLWTKCLQSSHVGLCRCSEARLDPFRAAFCVQNSFECTQVGPRCRHPHSVLMCCAMRLIASCAQPPRTSFDLTCICNQPANTPIEFNFCNSPVSLVCALSK
jgi:hypothetical protein